MASFNPSFDWNSPLTGIDENDFILMLQKQFPILTNTTSLTGTDATKLKSNLASNASNVPPATTKAQQPNSVSPLTSDSSPSPASAQDDAGSLHSTDGNHQPHAGPSNPTFRTEDDTHKRKASADDFKDEIQGQPSPKSQHLDKTRKTRKSGERVQDESRLLKRKEQNRAAQRAFRERKEKHVKDLEDRVAELEAKTESQATENENLRDMLSRLQNENTMLKQSTFTFSLPNRVISDQQPSRSSAPSLPGSMNLFSNASSEAGPSRLRAGTNSSATASSHDSPNSMFDRFDSFSNGSPVTATSPRTSTTSANTPGTTTTPDLDAMTYFGSTGPFQTIASNPMFTSYYDPILSMNAFASFGGWDKWDNDATMANASTTSTAPDNNNSALDGLFGEQFSNLIPLSQDFLSPDSAIKTNTPAPITTASGDLSPVAHHNLNNNHSSHNGTDICPKTKADVERMIANGPKGTFGAPVGNEINTASASSNNMQVEPNEYDVAFQEALGKAGKLHQTNVDGRSNNYNIDELCVEMQRKAKCSMGNC